MNKELLTAWLNGKLSTYERLLTKASGRNRVELEIKIEATKEVLDFVKSSG